jgi:hypothetical protein
MGRWICTNTTYTKIGKKCPLATDYPLKEVQKRVATISEVILGWINTD